MHMQVMQPPVAKRHGNDGLVPVFQVAESVATSTAQSNPPFKGVKFEGNCSQQGVWADALFSKTPFPWSQHTNPFSHAGSHRTLAPLIPNQGTNLPGQWQA